jgi:alkanesulfonate monooxygenase SsuD/methylene tetrahydromethanopterin reductase-like flavin-dependent oxidoreductase (luciferase family)
MAYPIRFADHEGIRRVAIETERQGYDSVLVNDHYSTMPYVREVACLDQISGGRLVLGVGVGAYRAEFEAIRPNLAGAARKDVVTEVTEALQLLLQERRASYRGTYVNFKDVELYPKPRQDPLPLLSCGNAIGTIRRAATLCSGWMPAGLAADRLNDGVRQLREYAESAGRDPAALTIAPQLVLRIDDDQATAASRFRESQVHEHLVSLRNSTLRDLDIDSYLAQNLVGSPGEIVERIEALRDAGANHLAGMIVVANTEAEMIEQIQRFAAEVGPHFPSFGSTEVSADAHA